MSHFSESFAEFTETGGRDEFKMACVHGDNFHRTIFIKKYHKDKIAVFTWTPITRILQVHLLSKMVLKGFDSWNSLMDGRISDRWKTT